MTDCTTQNRFDFTSHFTREVVGEFNGGTISSDAGMLLFREADQRLRLLDRFSECFVDARDQRKVEHTLVGMLTQRVYALAMGYEDINDHEQLRHDPLMGLLAGKRDPGAEALAGKSTLNRMELGDGLPNRYKKITYWRDAVDELMVDIFIEAHESAPEMIVLDIDTTDVALHGQQEDRFYHGFYDHYCYLPLYVFAGEHVLCARLRPSNIDPSAGSRKVMAHIVEQIRQKWPGVKIVIRGDSGFCREELMHWCECNQVGYVLGLARNAVLERKVETALQQAQQQYEKTGKAARVFAEFEHETVTGTWSQKRRVIAKAEYIDGKSNPRFIVTSLDAEEWAAQRLYEEMYCARGDMENRIKEQFSLFADRVSAGTLRANQLRLYLSVMSYMLVCAVRRIGLKGTELARAQVNTIRLKLIKIGAQIRVSVRKIWISFTSSYPSQSLFGQVYQQLRS